MSTFGLYNFVTSLQAEKRAKRLARKCLRASLSRLQQRYSSVLVPGNARFESLLGHLSVVTLIGHDYPRTLHLCACTALQFREMFVLYMWSLIRRYRDSYRQRRDQFHRSTGLPEETQKLFVRRSMMEPETWYAVLPFK
jgi:hypothetical protein